MDFPLETGTLEKLKAYPQATIQSLENLTKVVNGSEVSIQQTSQGSSDENPQTPETLDQSTPTIDFVSLKLSDLLLDGIEGIDPDRPPISQADKRKYLNQ